MACTAPYKATFHFHEGNMAKLSNSTEDKKSIVEKQSELILKEQVQHDRAVLARLLKLGLAHELAAQQSINLESNEELSRMIPILCAYFSQEELTELVGTQAAEHILNMHRMEALQNLYLESELQHILHAFREAKIPLMLFKGPALAYTIYPQTHLRTYHDIDALIHADDIPRAQELLVQMGYSFYDEFRVNAIDNKRSGYNYVLKRPDSWLEVLIELHTAPHASEIGSAFDVQSLWASSQPISLLGEQALTMDMQDHLLYLCWHYRFHGFTRLLWLYDIVMLVRASGTHMEWTALIASARRQHLATTLYYCLSWCRDIFGVALPDDVFDRLRPPRSCRLIVERIALPDPAKALSSAQSSSRRIIAQRSMVDHPLALLQAGLAALFPSPAILNRRYMSKSRLPVQFFFLYYLIHPWITLAKGLRYLLKPARKRRTME